MAKFLIIRFSSIGDIIQCMNVVNGIKNHFPDAEIHWIARKDMGSFLNMDKRIDRVWGFDKKTGFKGLLQMARQLKAEKFDYIYDFLIPSDNGLKTQHAVIRLKNSLIRCDFLRF